MYQGVLYYVRVKLDGSLHYCLVVPASLKLDALGIAHESHFGQKKTIIKVEESFYWPGYRGDVIKYIKECRNCQEFKEGRALRRRWQELPPAERPLQRISVDLTDLINGYQGYQYVLTVTCHYSRYVAFYKLRNKTSETVADHMLKYFLTVGVPDELVSDLGTEFRGYEFQRLCTKFQVQAHHTLPFHPQGNSINERMHRTFKTILAIMSERNPLSWPKYLDEAAYALNTAVHSTTGAQPYFAFNSRHARRGVGVPLPAVESEVGDVGISEAHEVIRETSRRLSRRILDVANRNRVDDESLEVGDLVLVKNEYQIPGTARKLNRKWTGPYRVEHVIRGGAAYQMSDPFEPDHNLLSRAAEKVKRFYPVAEFLEPVEREDPEEPEEFLETVEQEGPEEPEENLITAVPPVDEPGTPNVRAESEEHVGRYPQRVRRPRVPYTP